MITIDSLKIHVQSADCLQVNGRNSFYSGHTVSFLEDVSDEIILLTKRERRQGYIDRVGGKLDAVVYWNSCTVSVVVLI